MSERGVSWVKACDCRGATATTGRIVIADAQPAGVSYTITLAWHPGPVCDKCDTPWERDD